MIFLISFIAVQVKQYADDTTMTLVAKDIARPKKGSEQDLEGVLRWANGNRLENPKLLLLGRKRRQKELVQVKVETVGDEKIVRSKAVKCLGVVINDELNWKEQEQNKHRMSEGSVSQISSVQNMPGDLETIMFLGGTPLHVGTEHDCVKYLVIEQQVEPLCQDEGRVTPLHLSYERGCLNTGHL